MREQYKEPVREEMKDPGSGHYVDYCHDLHSMSIADLIALRNNLKGMAKDWKELQLSVPANNFESTIKEIDDYLYRFSMDLSERTVGFYTPEEIYLLKNGKNLPNKTQG